MTEQLQAAPPRTARRRWLWALGFVLVLLAAPLAFVWYQSWSAQRDFEAALAETDQLDPGWRDREKFAPRQPIPDERNSARQVMRVNRLTGGGVPMKVYDLFTEEFSAIVRLNHVQHEGLLDYYTTMTEARTEAFKLKDMPVGRFEFSWDEDQFGTSLDDVQRVRDVAGFLSYDAWLRAQEEDARGAMDACRALLNTGRSLGEEPHFMPLLVRHACLAITQGVLERVLAQTEPTEEMLLALQQDLERELAESTLLLTVLRGERLNGSQMIEFIQEGKIKPSEVGLETPPWLRYVADYLPFLALGHIDRARYLRTMNQFVEAAKLPPHEQLDRFDDIREQAGNLRNLFGGMQKVAHAHARSQAQLRTALVAVAAERFRLKHDRWPETTEELVEHGLLAAVPLDPFDGQPLRWRRVGDGVLIYSVGMDRIDNQGNIAWDWAIMPGSDIGFRLWDPAARRQPPLPIRQLPKDE